MVNLFFYLILFTLQANNADLKINLNKPLDLTLTKIWIIKIRHYSRQFKSRIPIVGIISLQKSFKGIERKTERSDYFMRLPI